MSLAAYRFAQQRMAGLTGAELKVLLALADHRNPYTGRCCPSVATIAGACGLGERWVQRCLHQLESKGVLTRNTVGGRAHASEYRLPVPLQDAPGERVAAAATPDEAKGWSNRAGKGGHSGTQRVVTAATRTVEEPKREPRGATPPPPPQGPAAAPPARADPLQDAVVAVCGRPETRSEWGATNRAVKELRDAGATPEDVPRRAAEYRRRWPKVSLTASALVKHWGTMGRPAGSNRAVDGNVSPGQSPGGALPGSMAVQRALYEQEQARLGSPVDRDGPAAALPAPAVVEAAG